MTYKSRLAAAALIATAFASSPMLAATTSYKGTAQTTAQKSLLPLGNGDAVVTSQSDGVAAISTDPPVILAVKCAGLGMVKATDEYSGDGYCNFSANDQDSLVVKGSERPGSPATLVVIGGSGRWAGASGKGLFTRLASEGEQHYFNFEIEVTTP